MEKIEPLNIAENMFDELRTAIRLHFLFNIAHTHEALDLLIDRINYIETNYKKIEMVNLK